MSAWRRGTTDANLIEGAMLEQIRMFPAVTLDYIAVIDPDGLASVRVATDGTIIAVAGRVGTTRLLDNHILGTEFR